MTVDPRAALDRLIAALEAHHHAVSTRRGPDDPAVDDAYYVLADAFEVYDDSLDAVHGESTPFVLADDAEDAEDDDEAAPAFDADKVPDEAFDDLDEGESHGSDDEADDDDEDDEDESDDDDDTDGPAVGSGSVAG